MTSAGIVTLVCTLIASVIAVGGIIFKLSRTLAVLETTMKSLQETNEEIKTDLAENSKEVRRILNDHEMRLVVLEHS